MIKHPFFIIVVLIFIEISILVLSQAKKTQRYFHFLPSIFWIYFLPMVLSTAGLLESTSPVYKIITKNLLPVSLCLLLITVDLRAILKLGPMALMMFLAGSFGIVLGTVAVFFLFKGVIGVKMYSGFGALAASWTGGSANMIAVKEALSVPDDVFLPMVVVDTIVPYFWMGCLVAAVGFQKWYDSWNNSSRDILDKLSQRARMTTTNAAARLNPIGGAGILIIAGAVVFISQKISQTLPVIENVVSSYTWTIILVSVFSLLSSLTSLRRVESYGSTRLGYFILYFVLTAIGAQASLAQISSTWILILAGFLIALIHMFVLLLASRVLRAPLFLVACSSQANIGGVASAPVVAEVYHPGLASVGLLLAIAGNIIGTFAGILTSQACYFMKQF